MRGGWVAVSAVGCRLRGLFVGALAWLALWTKRASPPESLAAPRRYWPRGNASPARSW
jgi:hypothetical protein